MKILYGFGLWLCTLVAFVAPASAQFGGGIVFDPSMYARQLQQLQQEIQTVLNLAGILRSETTGGKAGAFGDPNQLLGALGAIITQNEGLSYQVGDVTNEFKALYPGTQTVGGAQAPLVSAQETLNTLSGVLANFNAVSANWPTEDATLNALETANATATGMLQAQEVTNELELHLAREMQISQQLQMAAANALVTAKAEEIDSQLKTRQDETALNNKPVDGDIANPAYNAPPPTLPGQ